MSDTLEMPVHEHLWLTFTGGRGCSTCPAWESFPRLSHLIDALPTSLLEQPPKPREDPVVTDDLHLDVMNDLLEISRGDVAWGELEAMAARIIDRVHAS